MRNGTQEELDAAREDMTLLPFGAKFKICSEYGVGMFDVGDIVVRHLKQNDDAKSIAVYFEDLNDFWYVEWEHLEVIND